MADNDQYDDEDLDLDNEANLVRDLRRQIKSLSKEKAELAEQLTGLKSNARERSVADVLASKGVNAKVAKFIPADVEGDEAIAAWLTENADVFGFTVTKTDGDGQANEPDPEQVAAAKRLQTLGQSAQSPSKVQDLEARLANAKDEAEIQAIWAQEIRPFFL